MRGEEGMVAPQSCRGGEVSYPVKRMLKSAYLLPPARYGILAVLMFIIA